MVSIWLPWQRHVKRQRQAASEVRSMCPMVVSKVVVFLWIMEEHRSLLTFAVINWLTVTAAASDNP